MRQPGAGRWSGAAVVLLAAAALSLASCSCNGGPKGQRLVLITIDTLRYDRFAGGRGGPSSMPQTLALAGSGLVFDRCYAAASSTQPSHATMFTALHPWQHGVTSNGQVLNERFTTVAEILKGAGFETDAVIAALPVASRFGFAKGFDAYDENFTRSYGANEWEGVRIEGDRFYSQAEPVTDAALSRLDKARGTRQFFWFHYFDPHAPYGDSAKDGQAANPFTVLNYAASGGKEIDAALGLCRRLYDLDVAYVDRSLQRLFERLRSDERRFETSMVFVSDHGESLGEDGSMGHGDRLTEEQLHVPLFIVSPRVRPGTRADLAGSIDIAPTLLSLAGVAHSMPGGRDLTAPAPPAAAQSIRIYGMRRTYARPSEEMRIDGRKHPLDPLLFYTIGADGILHAGNSRHFVEGPEPPGGPDAEASRQLLVLFRAFESQLAGRRTEEATDPETLRALQALGYAR